MRLECTELRKFIDLVGEDRALQALSSFSVKRNPYIRSNAVADKESVNAGPLHKDGQSAWQATASYPRTSGS